MCAFVTLNKKKDYLLNWLINANAFKAINFQCSLIAISHSPTWRNSIVKLSCQAMWIAIKWLLHVTIISMKPQHTCHF